MIETKKTCYRCEFCRKLYELKNFAESHEINCVKNPANSRPCFFCEQAEMREQEYWFDTYCGDDSKIVKALYCKAKETFIYPPKVGRSHNGPYEFGDESNKPMPKTCNIFDEWYAKEKAKGWFFEVPANILGATNA